MLRLGLAPQAFWALSLAEWAWLLDAALGAREPLDAAELNALIHRYPDKTT